MTPELAAVPAPRQQRADIMQNCGPSNVAPTAYAYQKAISLILALFNGGMSKLRITTQRNQPEAATPGCFQQKEGGPRL
jgi:hypothetical protein